MLPDLDRMITTTSDPRNLLLYFLKPRLSDLLYPLPLPRHLLRQLSPPPLHLVQLAADPCLLLSQPLQPISQVLLLSEYLTCASLEKVRVR